MGKPTGYLENCRAENPLRPENERMGDYRDLHTHISDDERRAQVSRCMNCGVPYCQSAYGCPLHNLIPEWNDLIYRGQTRAAFDRLVKTAPFPEFTGHVCPALCEKACMLAEEGGVTNRDNELYLIEAGFKNGWMQPRIPTMRTGKRVAVVGSGPSGLAVADRLNRLGHTVTIYEAADKAGGLLMYGIPNMKLPKEIVARRIELMQREGVRFVLGTRAVPEILTNYDAVALCGGARKPRALRVPGEDAEGVCFAVNYLTEATRALMENRPSALSAAEKHVVIVGGGDTGNDCVGTALRQGCASVTQLELMPAAPVSRTPANPWPEWPRTLRTDYGQEEAIARQGQDPRRFETTVKTVLTDDAGRVRALEVVRVARSAAGRMEPIPGTEELLPCQLLLIAAGFVGCDEQTAADFALTLSPRGTPVGEGHRLSPGLYAAGDMYTGQSLVVRAIADGLACADEIDADLK